MEFRQLSYFVAVVEAGTITEASRRVHVAQPALTRQIRLLEEDLGTRLLDRHARGVRLTMAGRALYEEALLLLDQRSQIKARLTALGSGRTGTLRLGITVAHLWVPEVARMMGQYRAQYPGVAFEVFPLLSGPQLERLCEGTLDAGVVYLDGPDYPGLDTLPLKHDSLVLALPETSPWAKCPPQCLADLQEEDFVWGFRSASPMYYDRMLSHFKRLGFAPRVVQYGADNITILSMVAAGLGFAIVTSASRHHPLPGVRFVRLPELDRCDMPLWLAWRHGNDSPTLCNLIQQVQAELSSGA
ncbi:LysR family transcriptional regulator [Halomonas sp. DP8Y7-3]|uniref:LysR family transcriptional regulator n=1 Tax=Halomonas sp. DP8Y7-3 TaxID=2859079 RepID=UPI001C93DC05|nr:LysR family transcriptional regulator [Halomonas sp. DP8Y7-3]MBY5928454.1 LysR family transcriptional regulator [Halomonas sp. DP8Y7-3]